MTDRVDGVDNDPKGSVVPHGLPIDRRRLLRGAAGAAPVLLTLVSRPVIAGGGIGACRTASAFGSINASRPGGTVSCSGRTPGYWKNHSSWPSPYVAAGTRQTPSTQFDAVFGSAGGYPGNTLLDVLKQGGGGKNALARQIVAALLNAAKGWTPGTILSVNMVGNIWTAYVTQGYYSPTAGVNWNSDQIVTWLKSTMPL